MAEPSTVGGGCLCGAIRFEIDAFVGPFELCHCSRCRKASGSAFVAGIGVRARHFRFREGESLVRRYEAAVLEHPPGYATAFCSRCGSPAPDLSHVADDDDWFELAAGTLDEVPGAGPDRHIFVDHRAKWDPIEGDLPKWTKRELVERRIAEFEEKRGRWSRS